MSLLQTIMRNTTRNYVAKKSATFSCTQLKLLLDAGLLNEEDPVHLESKVGGILAIYGLLRISELLKLTIDNVLCDFVLFRNENRNSWEVSFPYATKTRKEGFAFFIPGKYVTTFGKYIGQFKPNYDPHTRFLKNYNKLGNCRVLNLGEKKGWNLAEVVGNAAKTPECAPLHITRFQVSRFFVFSSPFSTLTGSTDAQEQLSWLMVASTWLT